MSAPTVFDSAIIAFLLELLDGTAFANAIRRNGKPCRIRLADDLESLTSLVHAHVHGEPATLEFHAEGRKPWRERVDHVVLAAFCPASDGLCRWVGIDLDGADHGNRGLLDPVHASRTIAERAANAGLMSGLIVARSRRGQGRHVFLVLPEPTPLADAVLGVAALTAAAFKVAASDVAECGADSAFRCVNGSIARPGDAGAVELIPHSTAKPTYGWALALPGAGAFAAHGGGVIVDPFTDKPILVNCVPRCDRRAWHKFIREARASLAIRYNKPVCKASSTFANHRIQTRSLLDPLDARTRAFLEGRAEVGSRNMSAFAASANLLGCGVEEREAERLILAGAVACGLARHEALSAFRSASRTLARKAVRS